jgi:hypothetical protein
LRHSAAWPPPYLYSQRRFAVPWEDDVNRPVQDSQLYQPLSADDLLQTLGRGLQRSIGAALDYVAQHRDARAAEEVYRSLSRLSDAELARRGLRREQIAEFAKGQFQETGSSRAPG